MLDSDPSWMLEALSEAQAAFAAGEVPVGAVLVHENKIIARAHNQTERTPCATAHAELLVIAAASQLLHRWRLEGCTLFVTLEPCPMCAMAIRLARVAHIVYGAHDPRMGYSQVAPQLFVEPTLGPPPQVTGGVQESQCSEFLKKFFRERRLQKN